MPRAQGSIQLRSFLAGPAQLQVFSFKYIVEQPVPAIHGTLREIPNMGHVAVDWLYDEAFANSHPPWEGLGDDMPLHEGNHRHTTRNET